MATGSFERPLIFNNNDRPGIMLAGSASKYAKKYKVTLGQSAVIFTNNDECINLWNGMIEATWEDYNNEQQKIRNYFPIKYTSQCFSNLPSLVGTLDGIYYLAGNKIKCKP